MGGGEDTELIQVPPLVFSLVNVGGGFTACVVVFLFISMKSHKAEIVRHLHEQHGHFGSRRTVNLMYPNFFWASGMIKVRTVSWQVGRRL